MNTIHTSSKFSYAPAAVRRAGMLVVCCGALQTAGLAITHTWDGGGADDSLTTAGNWSTDTVPVKTDTIVWDGTEAGSINAIITGSSVFGDSGGGVNLSVASTQTGSLLISSNSNTLSRALRFAAPGSITIAAGAGSVTFGGTNAWSMILATNSTGTNAFTFTNNSSNAATIGSAVTITRGGSGTRPLNFTGSGDWNVGATIIDTLASINKTGAGKLTYSGTTGSGSLASGVTVNEGTLVVTGTLSNAASAVTVSGAGSRLAGTGTIAGTTTLGAGTFLDVGVTGDLYNDFGFDGALDVTGATVSFNLDSGTQSFGQLVANGLTLGGATLSINDAGSTVLAGGTSFLLVDNTSAGSISGAFAGLAEGDSLTIGVNTYVVSYVGGTGNDVTLTVSTIPEPSNAALLVSAGALLVVFGGRRRNTRA